MKYNNTGVRRQNRLLDESEALDLLKKGEYGILSMVASEDGAYGVPLSFVWDGKKNVYMHCAPEGKKLDLLKVCNKVSFSIVGKTKVIPDQFTTGYESIILKGIIIWDLPKEEKMKALDLLIDKYSSDYKEKAKVYIEKSFYRTAILRFDVIEFSGKSKRI